MSNGGKEKEEEDYRDWKEQKRERSRGEHCREGKHRNRSDERGTAGRESRSKSKSRTRSRTKSRSRERCRKNPSYRSDGVVRPLTN